MISNLSFQDLLNYTVVGAVAAICAVVLWPELGLFIKHHDFGFADGVVWLAILYLAGFLSMILNEFLDALSKLPSEEGESKQHRLAIFFERLWGMSFIPGAKTDQLRTDGYDKLGSDMVSKFFQAPDCFTDDHWKRVYWEIARSQESAKNYITRLRVLMVFSRNLSTVFGLFACIGVVCSYTTDYQLLFREYFWLVCFILFWLFRFGADRLVSDRNEAMFDAACFGCVSKKIEFCK